MNHFFGNIFYFFSGHTGIDAAFFHECSFQHNADSGYNSIASYITSVHNYGAHTNKYIIMNSTSMYDGIMPYGNIIANIGWIFLIRTMNHRTILHIHFIANPYIMNIAADYRIKPNAAIVAHYHITDNSSIRSYKTIIAKLRMLIKKGKYSCHRQAVLIRL